jgi:hypothetical protein
VGPLVNVNIATRWAHSRLSTSLFGDGCGPTRECRQLRFGGPIQDYRRRYSAVAVGPLANVEIATWWAHSGLSISIFGGGCGPTRKCRHLRFGGPIKDHRHHYSPVALGPLANVDIAARWAHSGLSTSLFGDGCGPTHECRHCQSVGPFRIIDIIIRRWLLAHSRMSTPPLRWAHSGSSTSLLAGGCGPISECRHCYSVGPCRIIDIVIRRRLWAHA